MNMKSFTYFIKYEMIKYSTIVIYLLLIVLCTSIIATVDLFDPDFNKHDIIVEAHGLIFDLVIFGLLISLFEYIRNKKEKISRFNEEIYYLSKWKNEESKYQILEKVRQLYELGQRTFHLSFAELNGANLAEFDLTNSVMVGVKMKHGLFVRSILKNVNLRSAKLREVYFTNAQLDGTNLSKSKSKKAKFTAANLIDTNFESADLRKASFINCYFSKVNFKDTLLDDVLVDNPLWFDQLETANSYGVDDLRKNYIIEDGVYSKEYEMTVCRLKRIKVCK